MHTRLPLGSFGAWLGQLFGERRAWIAPRRPRELELIETLALGGRRHLALVRCGEDRVLVGLGADSVDSMLRMDGASSSDCADAETGDKQ